jgi:hypothetical protein
MRLLAILARAARVAQGLKRERPFVAHTYPFDVNPLATALCGHTVGSFRRIHFQSQAMFLGYKDARVANDRDSSVCSQRAQLHVYIIRDRKAGGATKQESHWYFLASCRCEPDPRSKGRLRLWDGRTQFRTSPLSVSRSGGQVNQGTSSQLVSFDQPTVDSFSSPSLPAIKPKERPGSAANGHGERQ